MLRRLVSSFGIVGLVAVLIIGPLSVTLAGPTPSGYHWARKQSTFTLQLGSNLDGPWPSILKEAVGDWNTSGTVTFRIVAGQTGPQECRPVTGRVEVCIWRYGTQEGWLGLTRLYF